MESDLEKLGREINNKQREEYLRSQQLRKQ